MTPGKNIIGMPQVPSHTYSTWGHRGEGKCVLMVLLRVTLLYARILQEQVGRKCKANRTPGMAGGVKKVCKKRWKNLSQRVRKVKNWSFAWLLQTWELYSCCHYNSINLKFSKFWGWNFFHFFVKNKMFDMFNLFTSSKSIKACSWVQSKWIAFTLTLGNYIDQK